MVFFDLFYEKALKLLERCGAFRLGKRLKACCPYSCEHTSNIAPESPVCSSSLTQEWAGLPERFQNSLHRRAARPKNLSASSGGMGINVEVKALLEPLQHNERTG